VLLALTVVLLALGGAGYLLYSELEGNIEVVDLERSLGEDRPARRPGAGQNVLVLGSDSRAGDNASLAGGTTSGARSDTALVVHVPQDRADRAVAVSIPRDTLVSRPACTGRDGSAVPPARRVMFNSVYSTAGPACVVKTVESMSGVRLDHYMEIDFAGFKDLVDALGGVTVTVPEEIEGGAGGLDLTAGTHRLDGAQALAFVRTRHGVGDGSDLGRIGLQQRFLSALLAEVEKQGLLQNPARALDVARAATNSLTTDSGLASLPALTGFARSMDGVGLDTVMLPVAYDRTDPNRVVAVEPQASRLWEAVRKDRPVPAGSTALPATDG
jgi:LCP family protein required for cell wall assembly